MSKVSEWLRNKEKFPEGWSFEPNENKGSFFAYIELPHKGKLNLTIHGDDDGDDWGTSLSAYLTHEDALRLAHWIIENYGD